MLKQNIWYNNLYMDMVHHTYILYHPFQYDPYLHICTPVEVLQVPVLLVALVVLVVLVALVVLVVLTSTSSTSSTHCRTTNATTTTAPTHDRAGDTYLLGVPLNTGIYILCIYKMKYSICTTLRSIYK